MLTKESIAESLRQAESLTEGSDYHVSKTNRVSVCTQGALDRLVEKFGEKALKEVEGPEVFEIVQGQAFYPTDEPEPIAIPGA